MGVRPGVRLRVSSASAFGADAGVDGILWNRAAHGWTLQEGANLADISPQGQRSRRDALGGADQQAVALAPISTDGSEPERLSGQLAPASIAPFDDPELVIETE